MPQEKWKPREWGMVNEPQRGSGQKEKLLSIQKAKSQGARDALEELKAKIPFLRMWLNERSEFAPLVTNEDIGYWLGLNTAEEAQEARKKELIHIGIKDLTEKI